MVILVVAIPITIPRAVYALRVCFELLFRVPKNLGQIFGQKQARLASAHDVEVAIAVHVADADLKAAAGASPVVDEMANPFDAGRAPAGCQRPELIPVEAERLAFGGIGCIAREIALTRDQVRLAVAVQVNQRGGM